MFKQASFEEELYRSMEKSLVKNQVEDEHGFDKLTKATDLLSTAAAIFESAKMYAEADDVVEVISSLATAGIEKKKFDPTVARIQDALNKFLYTDAHGQPLVRDGEWGTNTQAAMQKFMNAKHVSSVEEAIKLLFQQSPPKQKTRQSLLVNPWESE
jgi:hypothetical protein